MTLPPSGYHAKAVTFGCMAIGKGVSSRASLLISVKVLVGKAVGSAERERETRGSGPHCSLGARSAYFQKSSGAKRFRERFLYNT
jgi:hypothetical protein